jgi:uncharacterized membrane protein YcjF (UPF0283 family)
MNDVDAALASSRFKFARDAAVEARNRRVRKGIGITGALLVFGPLFMVNLGTDHSFAHMHETAYWLALCITLIGALMVGAGMSRLLRNMAHQEERIEELRGIVGRMQAEASSKG